MSVYGSYPIETREGEIERLRVQAEAMAPEAARMADLIGVAEGWSALDIGCGPGGITGLLGARVGPSGRVVGLDSNERFLDEARRHAPDNVEFHLGNAYASDLESESFDLVHMRFVASTAGEPERLIREAHRLVRKGGVIALQEPDAATLACYPPHPAWDRLKSALIGAFAGVGADLELARRLYWIMTHSGLADVAYRPFILGVRAGDPMIDYLPSTVSSLRGTILRLGLMTSADLDRDLLACREHLSQRGASFTLYTVSQVWGRKPASV